MKSKKIQGTIFCLSFLVIFFSGIIRHDTDESKYLKLASEKQFDCVGQVFIDNTSVGSCVLIEDRFVLSAAHVFIESDTRPDTMLFNGQKVIAYVPFNQRVANTTKIHLAFKNQNVKVKRIVVHPNYLDSVTKGSCDIVILELEQPLKDIAPAEINRKFDELKSDVVGVGYGVSGPADKPELVKTKNKKIAGENIVDSISGDKYIGTETLLFCDFDHPTNKSCNKMGSAVPRPLEYICGGGDSGGGLFRNNKQKWELIGVCSGAGTNVEQLIKTGYYGQIMEWTRLSSFSNWIDKQTK